MVSPLARCNHHTRPQRIDRCKIVAKVVQTLGSGPEYLRSDAKCGPSKPNPKIRGYYHVISSIAKSPILSNPRNLPSIASTRATSRIVYHVNIAPVPLARPRSSVVHPRTGCQAKAPSTHAKLPRCLVAFTVYITKFSKRCCHVFTADGFPRSNLGRVVP